METHSNSNPVEVFDGTTWQAGIVKSLLENAEIEAFIHDEIMGTLKPWYTAGGGAGAVRVFVSEADYPLAKTIVDEYEKNAKE